MKKAILHTDKAPAALGPYSQAVTAQGLVFCSGQIGLDPATGELVQGGVEAQTRQVMANLGAVLKEAGTEFAASIKCTIFLKSMGDFAAVNAIYAEYFPAGTEPARACVEVSCLPKNVDVEIDCIAQLPS